MLLVEKGNKKMSPAGGCPGNDACNKPYNAAVCNTGNGMEACVSQVSGWIRLPAVHVFLFVLGELHKEAIFDAWRHDNTAARGAADGFNAQH